MESKLEWINRWAGSYTFISCSYWAPQYSESLKKILGHGFDTVLFIHKKGTASFFVKSDEFKVFGEYLADKTATNESESAHSNAKSRPNDPRDDGANAETCTTAGGDP